jgi:hypothetical protein
MAEAIMCLSNIIFLPRDSLSARERAVNYWQNFLCASAGTQMNNQFVDWVPPECRRSPTGPKPPAAEASPTEMVK